MSLALSTYCKLAETIGRNAPRYRTKTACRLAIRRVRWAAYESGSYGYVAHYADSAVRALQLRWSELDQQEWEARQALASAGMRVPETKLMAGMW